jgi:hypothetical protein
MDFFVTKCQELKGFKPSINKTKDPSAVSRVLHAYDIVDVSKIIEYFLTSDKSDKVGVTLSAALSTHSINTYLQSKAGGTNGIDRYKRVLRKPGADNTQKT